MITSASRIKIFPTKFLSANSSEFIKILLFLIIELLNSIFSIISLEGILPKIPFLSRNSREENKFEFLIWNFASSSMTKFFVIVTFFAFKNNKYSNRNKNIRIMNNENLFFCDRKIEKKVENGGNIEILICFVKK